MEANSQSLGDLMSSVATAAQQPGVSVVSMSWGFTEGQDVLAADEAAYDPDLTTPAGHQPVAFVASTGDFGSADPEYPAFSPNVVAVGGTTLNLNGDSSYNSETGWGYYSNGAGAFIGSGGGVSLYEPQPSYQAAVQSTGFRTTPDVSFVADPNTGAWIADTYNLPGDNPWEVVGGTSLSAPSWAGLLAVADQGRVAAGESTLSSDGGTTAQQALYSAPAGAFNSITSGTNGAYSAAAGYNLVTGLGTPVAGQLIPSLVAYNGTSAVNATATPGQGGSGSGSGNTNVVFNVFNALTAGTSMGHGMAGGGSQSAASGGTTRVPVSPIVSGPSTTDITRDRAPLAGTAGNPVDVASAGSLPGIPAALAFADSNAYPIAGAGQVLQGLALPRRRRSPPRSRETPAARSALAATAMTSCLAATAATSRSAASARQPPRQRPPALPVRLTRSRPETLPPAPAISAPPSWRSSPRWTRPTMCRGMPSRTGRPEANRPLACAESRNSMTATSQPHSRARFASGSAPCHPPGIHVASRSPKAVPINSGRSNSTARRTVSRLAAPAPRDRRRPRASAMTPRRANPSTSSWRRS